MINLIPKQEEKRIINDFYCRVFAMFFFMLGFAMVFAIFALFPAYLSSVEKKKFIDSRLKEINAQTVIDLDKKSNETIKELDYMVNVIEKNRTNNFVVTEQIIDKVLSKKIPGIKITKISYDSSNGLKTLDISGKAKNRESLLSFRKSFENDKSFSNIDLPISNFVKGSDIIFYLKVSPV